MTICKRATSLHTATCLQSSDYCAAVEEKGNAITHLPGTNWNNISLYKNSRAILAQINATSTSG